MGKEKSDPTMSGDAGLVAGAAGNAGGYQGTEPVLMKMATSPSMSATEGQYTPDAYSSPSGSSNSFMDFLKAAQEKAKKFGKALADQPPTASMTPPPFPTPGISLGAAGGGDPQLRGLRFALTPKQSQILGNMDPEAARRFILNQVLSGNRQYGPYTSDQVLAAREVGRG